MSGHKLEDISLTWVERMMAAYILRISLEEPARQRLRKPATGSERPHGQQQKSKAS